MIARFCCPGIACLLLAGALTTLCSPEALERPSRATLTFADRVAYQRTIEQVRWRHRIWPKENPGPKPPLEAVISQGQIEQKVNDYLRNSQFVADQRGRPITARELQAEIDRMASHTKQPDVLRELFAALGNDPVVVAECLARPIVAERLVRDSASNAEHASFGAKSSNRAAPFIPISTGALDLAQDDIAANLDKPGYKLPEISTGVRTIVGQLRVP